MPIVEDYTLTGSSARAALDNGLADAQWWQPNIDPAVLRGLQHRSDARAARDTLLWIALIVASGAWALSTVWSWWSIPAFAVYGALWGGASDSRWHECGHGTAFRTPIANEVVYYFASFGLLRGPTVWRWSHVRHHTDTIIVGRDYEIAFKRGMGVPRALFAFTGIPSTIGLSGQLLRHSAGRIDTDVATFVPEHDRSKVVWESRVFVAIVGAAIVASFALRSPLPVLFIGLPTLYGAWLVVFFGITQHAGLSENVLDHRRSTRTVYMNPIFRFLYSNMNYHVEHHIFPTVPYPALPALHRTISYQLAPALGSTAAAYRQVFATLHRQADDPTYEIPLEVPNVSDARRGPIDVEPMEGAFSSAGTVDDGADEHGADEHGADEHGVVDLGRVDEFEIGELRPVTVDGTDYVLVRLDQDSFCLADQMCTHQQVSLTGGVLVDRQIECPKHNARFDCATGAVTRKPARVPLRVYATEVNAGRVRAQIDVDPPASESKITSNQGAS